MEEKKELSFEEAMARLEVIVRTLENGSAPLDSSLGLFEEGVGLVRLCNEKLDSVEQKIKILVKGKDGEYDERAFDGAEDKT